MKRRIKLILVYERNFGYLQDGSERTIGKTLLWERSNSQFWLGGSIRSHLLGNKEDCCKYLQIYYDDRIHESIAIILKKSYN
jgi:hypothetical protein